ncbi:MAG: Stk1 family PASTA domain-containing Ser/Thr kinase [Acidimicrobiales bacterium]|jgi:serine/threonine-protein kinase|nr:Stk1 family PASTA domain-containing Ser/Thr kinase [Actinomycetota bacterium]
MEPVDTPRVFSNRYELTHLIARGGMAQVYRARDRLLDRPVALKVLFPELSVDRAFVERFRREAQAAANLSHPNIVPVFDWGEDGGTYFIVMEFVDGNPLSALLRNAGSLPPDKAADIASHVASALAYAHRHGVVHRDVKPGNVLITSDGLVKVTDFGIARAINTEESLTQTGAVMGTAAYFSPEQAEGIGVDFKSDIYSLGVVLFEMVTGRPPYLGDTPVAVASKHVRDHPPMPRDLNPAVPVALQSVILKAMEKSPDMRYSTAEEMRSDLLRFLEGRPVIAEDTAATQTLAALGATQAIRQVDQTQAMPQSSEKETANGDSADEDQSKKRTKRLVIALLVLLLALVVVAFFLLRSLGYLGGGEFSLPNVIGESASAATSKLSAEGLNVVTRSVPSANRSGTVVSTRPAPGKKVSKGDTVTLDVSSSTTAQQITVPQVVGQSFANAVATLQGLGLNYKERLRQSNQPGGTVLSQNPSQGSSVPAGTTIVLTVSTQSSTQVPNVVGLTQAAAGSALRGANLQVGNVTQQCSASGTPNGSVISSNPSSGTTVAPGTPVDLSVSSGPCQVTVLNVIGMSQSAATTALSNQQLTPTVVNTTSCSSSQVGTVVNQNPTGGTQVPANSAVTITVCSTTPPSTTTTSPPVTTTT